MRRTIRWGSVVLLALAIAGVLSLAGAQCPMSGHRPKAEPAAPPCAPPAMRAPAAPGAPMAPCAPGALGAQMGHGRRGPRAEAMMDRLGLSEDQQKAMAKIRNEAQTARRERMREMMRLRNEMQGEFLKDSPAAAALRSLAQRMGEIRTQLQIQQLEQRLAIHQLLTPEQRDRMMVMRRGGSHAGMMSPEMVLGMPGCGQQDWMGQGQPRGKGCMGGVPGCGQGCMGHGHMGEGDAGGWGPGCCEDMRQFVFQGDPGCCPEGQDVRIECKIMKTPKEKPHRAHRGGFPRCFPEGSQH